MVDAANNGEIMHQVSIPDREPIRFLSVEWYDKPMSYRECFSQMQELKSLCASTVLTIESLGETYSITSLLEFCQWLTEVFEGGADYGFSSKLCVSNPRQ